MSQWIIWFGGALHLFFGIWGASHALLHKRNPRAALSWCATCLFIPLGGPLFYLLFGINRVRRRAKRLSTERLAAHTELHPEQTPPAAYAEEFGRFERCARRITRHPVVGSNRVTPLHNGEEAYPAMLADIAAAKRRVWLAAYIFDTDTSGRQFIDELRQATERGVEVRVLIDGFGQLSSLRRVTGRLTSAGIPNVQFLPPRLFPPLLWFNLRNHRKILVVDDDISYTGGMNISDRHVANKRGKRNVVDLHFRMTGPISRQLAEIFRDDWRFASGEDLASEQTNPTDISAAQHTPILCRTLTDGPDRDLDNLSMLIQSVAASAERSLKIMTPYFLPGRELIAAFKSAAMRGTEVSVILPIKSDLPYMTWATRNMLWELLEWGVHIYYQPAPFVHSKLIVADDEYALVGSANIDARSLRLNFEIVTEIFDKSFSQALAQHFDETLSRSRRITLEEVDGRSLLPRLRDSIAWLFSPYL